MLISEPGPRTAGGPAPATRTLYLILFPAYLEERIEELLDEVGVPGYSRAPDVVGRGPRGRHFNNATWPGATGEIFTAVDADRAPALMERLIALNASLQLESRGIHGLHVLTWPCQAIF